MKKLSILFLLLAATLANAQEHKGFGVSLRTGVSRATKIATSQTSQSDLFIPNYGIGIFYDGHISKGLYYRGQVSFLSRNWKESYIPQVICEIPFSPCPSYGPFYYQKQNYFVSPELSLMYQFGKRAIKPFLQAGLRFDFYLKSRIVSEEFPTNLVVETTWKKIDGYRNINSTAIISGGVNFKHLNLQIEYNPTLVSFINKEVYERGYLVRYSKLNIQTLSVVAGYRF